MFLKNRLQPLKNLQLSFNVCKSESRLFKHCNSLLKFGLFDEVEVVGYTEDRVEEIENFSKHLLLRRFPLFFRNTKSNALKIVNVVIWTFQLLWVKRQTKYHTITIHSVIILPTGCLFKLFYKTRLVYDAHEHETESNG